MKILFTNLLHEGSVKNRVIIGLFLLAISFKVSAQNRPIKLANDSAFTWHKYSSEKLDFDNEVSKVSFTPNVVVSISDKNSFWWYTLDTSTFSIKIENQRGFAANFEGQTRIKKDITEDLYAITVKDAINKPFPRLIFPNPKSIDYYTVNGGRSLNLKNQITFMNAWYIGCTPCMEEIPLLNQLKQAFSDSSGYEFIGLHKGGVLYNKREKTYSFQSVNSRKGKFSQVDFQFTQYPIIDDFEKILHLAIYPTSIIVDKKGIIRTILPGKLNPEIVKILQESLKYYNLY